MARSHQKENMGNNSKLVLFDDDRAFSLILKDFAKTMGLDLDCFSSLEDLGSVGKLADYDGAIIDYHLENFTGVEIAKYFESFFDNSKPVLLISGKGTFKKKPKWPNVIMAFLHKDSGPCAILDKITRCVKKNQITRQIVGV